MFSKRGPLSHSFIHSPVIPLSAYKGTATGEHQFLPCHPLAPRPETSQHRTESVGQSYSLSLGVG